jgi:hypothetical protein
MIVADNRRGKAQSQKHLPSPWLLKSVNRQDADCQAPHGRARSDFLAAKVMADVSGNNHRTNCGNSKKYQRYT